MPVLAKAVCLPKCSFAIDVITPSEVVSLHDFMAYCIKVFGVSFGSWLHNRVHFSSIVKKCRLYWHC
jgi:hypothetical protein